MGNNLTRTAPDTKLLIDVFEEVKSDFMGLRQQIDTIAFYGHFREILDSDHINKKEEINLLVNNFEKLYALTDNQKKLIDKIISFY
jgi:hypothetical protein